METKKEENTKELQHLEIEVLEAESTASSKQLEFDEIKIKAAEKERELDLRKLEGLLRDSAILSDLIDEFADNSTSTDFLKAELESCKSEIEEIKSKHALEDWEVAEISDKIRADVDNEKISREEAEKSEEFADDIEEPNLENRYARQESTLVENKKLDHENEEDEGEEEEEPEEMEEEGNQELHKNRESIDNVQENMKESQVFLLDPEQLIQLESQKIELESRIKLLESSLDDLISKEDWEKCDQIQIEITEMKEQIGQIEKKLQGKHKVKMSMNGLYNLPALPTISSVCFKRF